MRRQRLSLPIIGLEGNGGAALTLERALSMVPGVYWVYVNPATEMAYVEYLPNEANLDDLGRAVGLVGYRTVLPVAADAGDGRSDADPECEE